MVDEDETAIELLPVRSPLGSPYNSSLDINDQNNLSNRQHSHSSSYNNNDPTHENHNGSLAEIDKPAFYLLVLLYFLQGIPVGLAFGSIPFLMKSSHLSYSQLGTFSLASYPYSLKLFWSPFVDSFYSKRVGRRRSWIIPIQFVTGTIFIFLGSKIDSYFKDLSQNLNSLTFFFFILVLMASTQDIAVDSWALVILSPISKSYASTAQTVGLNTGYFLSFTVFLAFNSKEFMNKYFRSVENQKDKGLISLGQYMVLSGFIYIITTLFVWWKIPEIPNHLKNSKRIEDNYDSEEIELFNNNNGWENLRKTYLKMYQVLSLSTVQQFIIILLICKFGFSINESATNLKLLDKGFSKEDLSLTVLIDFPFEIIFGYYVAKWSRGQSALTPWLYGYIGRLIGAIFAQFVVSIFPIRHNPETGNEEPMVTTGYFFLVIIQHLLSSLMSTIQFVSLAAFHTRIADPLIGGTYMTTLNTISNFGGTWPKFFLLKFIDRLSLGICVPTSLAEGKFASFWGNVGTFLDGNAIPKPTVEQLSYFKNFKLSKFNFDTFTTYYSSLETAYDSLNDVGQVKFWTNSHQLNNLPTCSNDPTKQICLNYFQGECLSIKDGYYWMNLTCVVIGTIILAGFIWRKITYLQALPESSWRVR